MPVVGDQCKARTGARGTRLRALLARLSARRSRRHFPLWRTPDRRGRRGADDQFGLHQHASLLGPRLVAQQCKQQRTGLEPHGTRPDPHGRERRLYHVDERHVVVAGHRNMRGTGEVARLERPQQAKGQKVVGGHNGGQVGCRIEKSVASGLSRLAIIGCGFGDIAELPAEGRGPASPR